MKTFILLIIANLLAITTFSQVEVRVVSNPCNPASEQTYLFEYGGELDGSATDWNEPNIFLPANAVQGELVFVNDGTTSGVFANIGTPPLSVETTTDGCETATWTQDLTGKIAVIWRGTCEFSCKADNAQNRGAIAIVLINHTGAAVGMVGGTCGLNVTIPVVMIGRTDGESLMNCIAGGGVIAFIGNPIVPILNNMSSSKADILMTESSAMPWDLAQNGTEYPVDFGIWVYNKGIDAQTGVTATVDVVYNGSSVYNQTSAPVNFAAPDTTYLDSNYFDLGTYAPVLWNVGTYTATYTINDTNDQDLSDNVFSFEFKFTNNEDIYAKCRTDSLNEPMNPTSVTLVFSLTKDIFETCISFQNEFAGQRSALALGMNFSAFSTDSMNGKNIEIKAYKWDDVFININSPVTYNNLNLLSSALFTYSNELMDGVNMYLPFDNPVSLLDNQRYLFCVSNNNGYSGLAIGFDNQLNYYTTSEHYLQPIIPLGYTGDEPSIEWFTEGFGWDYVPSISIKMDIATSIDGEIIKNNNFPYPNPVTNLLTIPLRQRLVGNVKIEVVDVFGKVVLSENKTISNEPLKVNVASIVNGNYLFKLTFSDGTSDVFKVSVNRQ